jgi:hypothetical protein
VALRLGFPTVQFRPHPVFLPNVGKIVVVFAHFRGCLPVFKPCEFVLRSRLRDCLRRQVVIVIARRSDALLRRDLGTRSLEARTLGKLPTRLASHRQMLPRASCSQ